MRTLVPSCDSCDIELRNDEKLRDLIDNCYVWEINLPWYECLTEHNWRKHPELLCEECDQYMLHIDLGDNKNKHFFSRVV